MGSHSTRSQPTATDATSWSCPWGRTTPSFLGPKAWCPSVSRSTVQARRKASWRRGSCLTSTCPFLTTSKGLTPVFWTPPLGLRPSTTEVSAFSLTWTTPTTCAGALTGSWTVWPIWRKILNALRCATTTRWRMLRGRRPGSDGRMPTRNLRRHCPSFQGMKGPRQEWTGWDVRWALWPKRRKMHNVRWMKLQQRRLPDWLRRRLRPRHFSQKKPLLRMLQRVPKRLLPGRRRPPHVPKKLQHARQRPRQVNLMRLRNSKPLRRRCKKNLKRSPWSTFQNHRWSLSNERTLPVLCWRPRRPSGSASKPS